MKTVIAPFALVLLNACATVPDASGDRENSVKPHSVPCDPEHPERPCTPEPVLTPAALAGDEADAAEAEEEERDLEHGDEEDADAQDEAAPKESPPSGVKPRRVPCDPARPELPCTPEPEAPKAP